MIILWVLGLTIAGGLLYRAGGTGDPFPTQLRDWCISVIIMPLMAWKLGLLTSLLDWALLLPCIGLFAGALSTYRYFLPKPKDYQWYHYALHGLFCALAMFPLGFTTASWLGIGIRCLICMVGVSAWSAWSKTDFWEEFGRGAILIGTMPLLCI